MRFADNRYWLNSENINPRIPHPNFSSAHSEHLPLLPPTPKEVSCTPYDFGHNSNMPKVTTIDKSCPFTDLMNLLSRPWTIHILWALHNNGPSRFGVLRRVVSGISARVLTNRLRLLEANRLILRHYEPSVPPKVTYSFTKRYAGLAKVLSDMNDLAIRWRRQDLKKQASRHETSR